MGPDYSKLTSKTLQFAKLNGTNYHIWLDNMKVTLQAKSLWGVICGCELCPIKPPSEFPGFMTSSYPSEGKPLVATQKDGQELMDVLQSKEYIAWKKSHERYNWWLNKDDAAIGLIQNAVKYAQNESIINCRSLMAIWEQLHINFVEQYSGVNIHYYYQELFLKKWDSHSSISDHLGSYYSIHRHFLEANYKVDDHTIINAIFLIYLLGK